jgi:hypothetical protein
MNANGRTIGVAVEDKRPSSTAGTPSNTFTKAALERVREKLVYAIFWIEPEPRTPEVFALSAAKTLDAGDFGVLKVFENLVGEHVAQAWLDELLREIGYAADARRAA